MEQMAGALQSGVVVVDANGEILWVDENTRRRVDGELTRLQLPLKKEEARVAINCMLAAVDIEVAGEPQPLTVIQAVEREPGAVDLHRILAAVEEVMTDSSWFTGPMLEKLKAALQAA